MTGRRVLLLGAWAMLLASSPVRAEITIHEANYAGGVLTLRGETAQAGQRVTLDGRYSEWTNSSKQFLFRVRYLPSDCTATIRAGQEARPAYVANCEPKGATLPESVREPPQLHSDRRVTGGSAGVRQQDQSIAGDLRVVGQPCDRGGECQVVCRPEEVALNAYCSRGRARLLDERTVACSSKTPGEIVAYCMGR